MPPIDADRPRAMGRANRETKSTTRAIDEKWFVRTVCKQNNQHVKKLLMETNEMANSADTPSTFSIEL